MLHRMKINDNAFDRMKKGIKKREYRVNDEKRQLVRCDDIIEFEKLSNPEETILMDVKGIEKFLTLEEAISSHLTKILVIDILMLKVQLIHSIKKAIIQRKKFKKTEWLYLE